MPVLGVLLVRKEAAFAQRVKVGDTGVLALRRFCSWIAVRMVSRPASTALSAVLVVGCLALIYIDLEPRYRLADQVPDKQQAVEASGRLDAKLTGANPIDVLIEFPKGASLYAPETLGVIADVHAVIEKQAGVGNVWSLDTLRRWLAEKAGMPTSATLIEYVDLLPGHLTRRFISAEKDAVVVSGRIPDVDASQLLPVVNEINKNLDAVRNEKSGLQISVTGLSAIAARNSADMIGKLNRALTIEIFFVAALHRPRLPVVRRDVRQHHAGHFPDRRFRRGAVAHGGGAAIRQRGGADRLVRPRAQRDDPLPQPAAARGPPSDEPGRGGRAGHRAGRAGLDPHLGGARLRACSDGVLRPAVARLFGWLSAFSMMAALVADLLILRPTATFLRRIVRSNR